MNRTATWLKSQLDYEFSDPLLLTQALTHRSAAARNNERLEFLGDAVLDFVVSDLVYRHYPNAHEGELSRLRAELVKDSTLAEISSELGVGKHLVLGSGEKKSGGHRRHSILADAMEALFGAMYLDQGFAAVQRVIDNVYQRRVEALPDAAELKDPKTRLQEYLQARGYGLPVYTTTQVSGKAHQQHFDVECRVDELELRAEGAGGSRRDAEQEAAARLLAALERDDS